MRRTRRDMRLALQRLSKMYEDRRELAEQSVVLRAADTCLNEMGGIEAFGRFMADTFVMADRSESLTARREAMSTFKDWFKEYDAINEKAFDLAGMAEEDLRAVVVGSVLERIDAEPEFATALVYKAAQRMAETNPEQLDEVIAALTSLQQEPVALLTEAVSTDENP